MIARKVRQIWYRKDSCDRWEIVAPHGPNHWDLRNITKGHESPGYPDKLFETGASYWIPMYVDPEPGQIWKVEFQYPNPLFKVGRKFMIRSIDSTHYRSDWLDDSSPMSTALFSHATFREHCVFLGGGAELVAKGPDLSRFPHKCPRCAQPAYVGAVMAAVDCTNNECPTRKR